MRLAMQRVHHLGPVDRDDAHPALVGDGAEAVIGHEANLLGSMQSRVVIPAQAGIHPAMDTGLRRYDKKDSPV